MASGPRIGNSKSTRAQRAVDDPLVTGAVEGDHRVRIAAARREVVFRPAQIADAFFAGRRDKLDRVLGCDPHAVDLARQSEHHREPTPIVVDARSHEALRISTHREIGVTREDGVEMRADHYRRTIQRSFATSDDVADDVGLDARQSGVMKAARDPFATLALFAGRSGDLGDRDLCSQDRIIARGKTRVCGRERAMR